MKKIKRYITACLSLILIIPPVALAKVNLPSMYIGVNAGVKQNGFTPGYGDNLFNTKQPIANIFAGIEIIPHLNVEINLETTKNRQRHSALSGNDSFLGVVPGDLITRNWQSDIKFSSIGADLIYKFNPICCDKFNILLGAGIKITKVNLKSKNLSSPSTPVLKLTENNTKGLIKLSAGYEYMFTNNYGMRGLVSWENTSALKPVGTNRIGAKFTAQLKNSMNYTLGVLYKL